MEKSTKNKGKKPEVPRYDQPEPFSGRVSKGMVREHAYRLYRDKLSHTSLTLQDWVLAERDLVESIENDGVEA